MREAVRRRAQELGFEVCRFATAAPPQSAPQFRQWLAGQRHGQMAYLERNARKRVDPRQVLPGAATIITLAASYADEGKVMLTIYKAGWIIGGSGGSGSLYFNGRYYPLSTGGLDYGLVFGGSKTVLYGRVSNIWSPSDVAGVYAAAGAGLAVGAGARAIVLTNQKGAVLELTGRQVGLLANLDLSGLAITLQ